MLTDRIRARLLATTIICGLAAAVPALAQTRTTAGDPAAGNAAAATPPNASGEELIVVTGSRIAQPQASSSTPLTVVSGQELKLTGSTRVEDLLNSLPQVTASLGSNQSNGSFGTASIDLRGLGPVRTLVLINGRRLVPGDPRFPVADINFIPGFLVRNIDVTTGGASSTYGADAVAGVVNFRMDSDFEGFRIDGQYGFFQHDNDGDIRARDANQRRNFQVPTGNILDGQSYEINAAIGLKSPDGRGHATVYAGYRSFSAIRQDQRDFSNCSLTEQSQPGTGFNCGGSGTTAPTRLGLNGGGPRRFRAGDLADANSRFLVNPLDPTSPRTSLFPIDPRTGQIFINPASPRTNSFGQPIPQIPFRNGDIIPIQLANGLLSTNATGGLLAAVPSLNRVPTGTGVNRPYVGAADAFNFAPYNYYQRPDQRFTLGGFAEYEVASFFKPYLEVMFMDDQTNAVIAPSGIFGQTLRVNCDNPLLSASQVAEICTRYGYAANESAPLAIGRRNVEGGGRDNNLNHNSFRIVTGAKGEIAPGIGYDAYYQYGQTRLQQIYFNDFSLVRGARSVQVVNVGGVPTCRSVVDGTDATCVPYNVFTPTTTVQGDVRQGVTQAALNYLQVPGFQTGLTREQVVSGAITANNLADRGIKSPFAETGLGLSIGGEWRSEDLRTDVDAEFSTGDLAGQGGPTLPIQGGFQVAEFFAEASLPLVEKKPFFEELRAEAGYRYSDYTTGFSTDTYKFTGLWRPIRDITITGGYNRSVRAPNVVELFSTQSIGLFNGSDPCAGSAAQIAARGLTPAQCAFTGVSAAQFGTVTPSPAGQYNQFAGGNPNLRPERADSYTGSIVLQPRFIPRLLVRVDYFNIKVNNLITTIGANLILNQCAQRGDPFLCSLITRDANGTLYQDFTSQVVNTNLNTGFLKTSGIDVFASYKFGFSDFNIGLPGGLSFDFNGTYLDELTTAPGVTAEDADGNDRVSYNCKGFYGLNCGVPRPEWRHNLRVTYTSPGGFSGSVRWRHFGPVKSDRSSGSGFLADEVFLADNRLGARNYVDLAFSVKVSDRHQFRAGVNNVLDKDPPTVGSNNLSGTFGNGNTYPNVYDTLGRYIFVGFTGNF